MHRRTAGISFLVITGLCADALAAVGQGPSRLPPSAFPAVPAPIRKELERRHCSIPIASPDTTRLNIVQGHFRVPTRLDWAVLCAAGGYSSILVFWDGASPQRPGELAVATDADYTDTLPGGQVVFARAIAVADREKIPSSQPLPITHDGINNIHTGKSSLTYYWDDFTKRWVPLMGGD